MVQPMPKYFISLLQPMRQVPLERDNNIAVNGCSGFATSTRKGPFTAMLISCSKGTYLTDQSFVNLPKWLVSAIILSKVKGAPIKSTGTEKPCY